MTISKQLEKATKLIPKTNLILQEFLAVMAGRKQVMITNFNSKSEEELIKSNFPELAIIYGKKNIAGAQRDICIISRNRSLAEKTMKCFCKGGNYNLMGQFLDYPKCCINKYLYFSYHNQEYEFPLVTYKTCQNTKRYSFLTNNLFNFTSKIKTEKDFKKQAQYFTLNKDFPIPLFYLQFISHIPCSYDCKESIKIGKKIDSLLKKYAPETEKLVKYTLSKPVLFFDLFKLIVFDGYFKNNVLHYSKIIPPFFLVDNSLMKKIKKGNKIIVDKEEIKIFKDNLKIFFYKKKNKMNGFILNFGEKE